VVPVLVDKAWFAEARSLFVSDHRMPAWLTDSIRMRLGTGPQEARRIARALGADAGRYPDLPAMPGLGADAPDVETSHPGPNPR